MITYINDRTYGYYMVIPQNVYKNVKPNTAVVYGVIMSVINYRNGSCYASNEYIANQVNLSPRTVSSAIQELKQKKFIAIKMGRNMETGQNYRKIIPYDVINREELRQAFIQDNQEVSPEQDQLIDTLYKSIKAF